MASIISVKPSDTFAIAKQIAPALTPGEVIGLTGDLGAGKTHFVKGLADGLGYLGEVTSPTFTLVHEYLGGLMPLYHFDFYRLESGEEAIELDLEGYLAGDGISVVEWADKFTHLLPAHTRWYHLSIDGESRRTITSRP